MCGWVADRIATSKIGPCGRCGGVCHVSVRPPGVKARRRGKQARRQVAVYMDEWQIAELERAGKPGELLRALGEGLVTRLRIARIRAAQE